MNRIKLLLIAFLAVVPLFGLAATANAHAFKSGNNVTVASNNTLNSTLFASGRNIDIAGTVEGDVFCTGQTITITGTVTGDVICAGQTLSISGTVNGDVRLAGQNITISGSVGQNASVATQSFTVSSSGKISGDVSVAATDANINGSVGRDLAATASTLTIDNTVGRNVHANIEHLRLQDNAQVAGFIEYTSPRKLEKNQGAAVTGEVTRHEPTKHEGPSIWHVAPWVALYFFVSMLLLALVLVLLIPRTFHVASDIAMSSLGKTFLIGLASSILVPVVLLALMFTVIGIPLALFGWLAWLVLVVLSGPFAAYLLGRYILTRSGADNAILTMLVGGVVVLILYMIPFLNILVALLVHWFGIGMLMQRVVFQRPQYSFEHLTDARDDRREVKSNVTPATAETTQRRTTTKKTTRKR